VSDVPQKLLATEVISKLEHLFRTYAQAQTQTQAYVTQLTTSLKKVQKELASCQNMMSQQPKQMTESKISPRDNQIVTDKNGSPPKRQRSNTEVDMSKPKLTEEQLFEHLKNITAYAKTFFSSRNNTVNADEIWTSKQIASTIGTYVQNKQLEMARKMSEYETKLQQCEFSQVQTKQTIENLETKLQAMNAKVLAAVSSAMSTSQSEMGNSNMDDEPVSKEEKMTSSASSLEKNSDLAEAYSILLKAVKELNARMKTALSTQTKVEKVNEGGENAFSLKHKAEKYAQELRQSFELGVKLQKDSAVYYAELRKITTGILIMICKFLNNHKAIKECTLRLDVVQKPKFAGRVIELQKEYQEKLNSLQISTDNDIKVANEDNVPDVTLLRPNVNSQNTGQSNALLQLEHKDVEGQPLVPAKPDYLVTGSYGTSENSGQPSVPLQLENKVEAQHTPDLPLAVIGSSNIQPSEIQSVNKRPLEEEATESVVKEELSKKRRPDTGDKSMDE
jgi:hypothetical protein